MNATRVRLNHPAIDSDGHTIEFEPGRAGPPRTGWRSQARQAFQSLATFNWYLLSPGVREESRERAGS